MAVIGVVMFHAAPEWLPGGYLGVDIFFVISGFLITRLIVSDLGKQRFSLRVFYRRRLLRIVPNVVLLFVAALAVGAWLLLPDELSSLAKHVLAGSWFVSNLLLWRETGYFDAAAETKPLLHLWSLAIEEQFYLVYPLLLLALWRSRWPLLVMASVLLAASWIGCAVVANVSLEAAFYWPVTRFWELLTGGVMSLLAKRRGDVPGQHVQGPVRHCAASAEIAALAGLALALVAMASPGARALPYPMASSVAVVAASAMIHGGPGTVIARHVLSGSTAVGVGRVSYALYLWHWPLLSFGVILAGGTPPPEARLALVTVAVVISVLTHRFFENPIRRSVGWRPVVTVLCAAFAVMLVAALLAFPSSVAAQSNAKDDVAQDGSAVVYFPCPPGLADSEPKLTYCKQSKTQAPTAVIVGDSHADHIFHGVAKRAAGESWMLLASASCPPLEDVQVDTDQPKCLEKVSKIMRFLKESPHIKTVVLAFFGNYFLDTAYAHDHVVAKTGPSIVRIGGESSVEGKMKHYLKGLSNTLMTLERAGKDVVWLVDVPELPFNPRACISRLQGALTERCAVARTEVDARQRASRSMLKTVARAHPSIRVFDTADYLCDQVWCNARSGDRLLYRDSHHLSLFGSDAIAVPLLAFVAQGRATGSRR